MGTLFGAIFGWWLFIAFISSFYFWAKKTDRSRAPIERRVTAAGYGLAWPYFAYLAVKGSQKQGASRAEQRAPYEHIPGAAGSATPPSQQAAGPGFSDPTAASWTVESGTDDGTPGYRGTHRPA